MKKALVFIFAFTVLWSHQTHAQDKKVALVSFYAVKQPGYVGKASKTELLDAAKLADDTAYRVAPLLENFYRQFVKNYADKFPFQLLYGTPLTNNRDYQQFIPENSVDDILNFKTNVPVRGYKVLAGGSKGQDEKNMLEFFADCDGLMKVSLNFEFDKRGVGPSLALVKVKANATISLYNKKGDKIFETTESALSQLSGSQIAGIPFMVPKKVMPLCENAADELLIAMQQDMPSIVQKAGAKL